MTEKCIFTIVVCLTLFATSPCVSAPIIDIDRVNPGGELSDAVYQQRAKALRAWILKHPGIVCLGGSYHNCALSRPDPTVVKKAQKLIDQAKVLIGQQDYFGALGLLLEENDLNWGAAINADWATWHEPSLRQNCFEGIGKTQSKEEFVKTMRHQWDLWREPDVADMLDRALANCGIDPRSPRQRLHIGNQLFASGDLRGAAMEYYAAHQLNDKIGEDMRGLCYDVENERDHSQGCTPYYWDIQIFYPGARPYLEDLIRLDKSKFKDNYRAYWRDLIWLGDWQFSHDEYSKALATYEILKEVKDAVQDQDLWAHLGACYLVLGNKEQAVENFKQSIDWVNANHGPFGSSGIFGISNYHSCYSYVALLCLLIKQGRKEEALAVIQKAEALIKAHLNDGASIPSH